MELVMRRACNLLVIMPTGKGKSLLFMLPAKTTEASKVTIVVLPLEALPADFERRCTRSRISHARWMPGQSPEGCSLVFVSPEHATRTDFLSYAISLETKGRLSRVVFDECHLILTQREFRECFIQLGHLRALATPFVLLTATLPEKLHPEVFQSLRVKDCHVVQAKSTRPDAAIKEGEYVSQWEKLQ